MRNKQEGGANLVRLFNFSDGEVTAFQVTDEEHRESLLKDLGQVIVFTGPRGSGKTLSMVYWAVRFLCSGHRVWSNFDIEFDFFWPGGEKIHYKTLPLDMASLYNFDSELVEGIVLVDELNLWVSARRSMSVANRLLNAVLQMTRKRRLTFLFSTQKFEWLDNQLRFQTDMLIKCNDQSHFSKSLQPGEVINWTVMDMSGFFSGQPAYEGETSRNTKEFQFWGKPLWNFFNSWQEFNIVEASRRVVEVTDKIVLDRRSEASRERDKDISEAIRVLKETGQSRLEAGEVARYFETYGVHIDSRQIGRYLKQAGFHYKQTRQGNYYELEGGQEHDA